MPLNSPFLASPPSTYGLQSPLTTCQTMLVFERASHPIPPREIQGAIEPRVYVVNEVILGPLRPRGSEDAERQGKVDPRRKVVAGMAHDVD